MASSAPAAARAVPELLRAIAVPRLHGSVAATVVEGRVRAELESIGLEVEARPFGFSALPGRFGAQSLGIVLAVTLPAAAWLAQSSRPLAAAVLMTPAIIAALSVVFADAAQLRLPLARTRGLNLFGAPPDAVPRFLVVAHRDSKSQPLPLAFRVGGAVAAVVSWLCLVLLVVLDTTLPTVALAAGLLGGLGGLLIACCGVGNDSDGALDNATGVAALLRIAHTEMLRGARDIGFLVTDAEEFGLVGARAEARAHPDVEVVINLDGLDDTGPIVLVEGRSPFASPPSRVTWVLDLCAAALDAQLRHRGLPPGLLLDHVPFSRAGHHAFTLMRGRLSSMARVHRPADTVERVTGSGVSLVARLVSDALERIRRQKQEPPV